MRWIRNRLKKLWRWICRPYRRWRTRRFYAQAVKRGAEQIRKMEDERILGELMEAARMDFAVENGLLAELKLAANRREEVGVLEPEFNIDPVTRPMYREPGDSGPPLRLEADPFDPKGFYVASPTKRKIRFKWTPDE